MSTITVLDRGQQRIPNRSSSDRAQGFFSLLDDRLERFAKRPGLSQRADGSWRRVSYAEIQARSESLAVQLREAGHAVGERMAILADSSPEWGIAFLGILRAGGVAVPLDIKLTESELLPILEDAQPAVLFVSPRFLEQAEALKNLSTTLWEIVVIRPDGVSGFHRDECDARSRSDRSPDEVAVITYTSGTTGRPKGVMTTFGTLIHQATSLGRTIPEGAEQRYLSILPLNHLFELVGGFLSILWSGGEVCYCDSLFPDDIAASMRERRITSMLCVPLFLDLIKRKIEKSVVALPAWKRLLFRALYAGPARIPSHWLRRRLFLPIHSSFGPSLRSFICGGAPLNMQTERFFERIGMPIQQGYGMTETGPVISLNLPGNRRLGSVGRPLPGVEVKIEKRHPDDAEGEILTRGPHVMKGYRNRNDLMWEVFDVDGWLHSGDLGRIDAQGFLHVTGRAKSLIVLGNGKKVQPEEVEGLLATSPLVSDVCVVGVTSTSGHEEVCAVVVPDKVEGGTPEEVEADVARVARSLAPYKRPSTVLLRAEELPRTTTAKPKRGLVRTWAEERRANQ